jgi:hypothetical protein
MMIVLLIPLRLSLWESYNFIVAQQPLLLFNSFSMR